MCENKGNKLVVDDIEVIVRGVENKPYYEIKYREVGNDDYNIGFGSYDLSNVLKWKEEEFEISPKLSKKATTNEELLDHLQEVEIAIACQVTAMSTLFHLLNAHTDQIGLDAEEQSLITCGLSAMTGCINTLVQKSDLVRRTEEKERKDSRERAKSIIEKTLMGFFE